MYAHAQVWTLLRVANQQSGCDQVVATTTATKSYDQHLCYRRLWKLLFHSTILFLPFPCAYKAKLTRFTLMIQMMRFKLSGGGRGSGVC